MVVIVGRTVGDAEVLLDMRKRVVLTEPDQGLGAVFTLYLRASVRDLGDRLVPTDRFPFALAALADPPNGGLQTVGVVESLNRRVALRTHSRAARLLSGIVGRGARDTDRVVLVGLDFLDDSVLNEYSDTRLSAAHVAARVDPFRAA